MRGDAALQRARRRRIPFEFSLAAGSVAMIVVALIDSAAFTPDHTGDRLAVMAAAVGVFSVVGGWQSALPVAAVGYLLFDGFLANRYGELTWNRQTGPHAIGVIALAVALGLIAGWLRSRSQRTAPIIRSRLSDDKLGDRSGTRRVRGPQRRDGSPFSSAFPPPIRADSDVTEEIDRRRSRSNNQQHSRQQHGDRYR